MHLPSSRFSRKNPRKSGGEWSLGVGVVFLLFPPPPLLFWHTHKLTIKEKNGARK